MGLGEGFGHLAVSVMDLDAEHADYRRRVSLAGKLSRSERDLACSRASSSSPSQNGYEVETLHGRFK
ncbi:hypothetical protein QN224_28965 [Sinorhizobium sp. 8-89]|uniref:hypothetical protein n=1 Tax=Sinorhizobium sp. 7-81 TaxID=3049087 RepID=UPI0024C32992|nr:hypothetical protein [Sinorhizobium sp. 7-81]MDK1389425.1 hypothetical protein [Sinorhizobium sp. 7-81]